MTHRILVVDDNEINGLMVQNILNHYSLGCDCAMSGAEAVAAAGKVQYALVFMDYLMPEMDGIEATRRIKALKGYENVPIVALSGDTDDALEKAFKAVGAFDMLHKPVDPADISRMLIKYELLDDEKESHSAVRAESEVVASEKLRDYLKDVSEINYDMGLKNSMGSENNYFLVLKAGVKNVDGCRNAISGFIGAGDGVQGLREIRIALHSLKSIFMNIGIAELSSEAAMLEKEVKDCLGDDGEILEPLPDGNIAELSDYHDRLDIIYNRLNNALTAYDEMKKQRLRNGEGAVGISAEEKKSLITECLDAGALCDIDRINADLEKLLSAADDEVETALLEEMIDAAGAFNYDLILDDLRKMDRGEAR